MKFRTIEEEEIFGNLVLLNEKEIQNNEKVFLINGIEIQKQNPAKWKKNSKKKLSILSLNGKEIQNNEKVVLLNSDEIKKMTR